MFGKGQYCIVRIWTAICLLLFTFEQHSFDLNVDCILYAQPARHFLFFHYLCKCHLANDLFDACVSCLANVRCLPTRSWGYLTLTMILHPSAKPDPNPSRARYPLGPSRLHRSARRLNLERRWELAAFRSGVETCPDLHSACAQGQRGQDLPACLEHMIVWV